MRLRYLGDPDRHYPWLGLDAVVQPGDVHDLADDPGDGRWEPADDAAAAELAALRAAEQAGADQAELAQQNPPDDMGASTGSPPAPASVPRPRRSPKES
jgi:hypothetical protein